MNRHTVTLYDHAAGRVVARWPVRAPEGARLAAWLLERWAPRDGLHVVHTAAGRPVTWWVGTPAGWVDMVPCGRGAVPAVAA